VNPLGVVSFPGELAAGLRALPELLAILRDVREDTRRMADNTDTLADVDEHLAEVDRVASVLPRMDERMAQIEGAMPVLVEVQQHLAQLPETIEGLNRGIAELVALMERLHDSLEPLGRLAERVPGAGRR
jgi:archaellum component FlaC